MNINKIKTYMQRNMCIYIYKYLRLKEQFFRIACGPSVRSVGTRGAVVRCLDWCDPLPVPRLEPIHLLGIGGLERSCADLSNDCVSNLRFPLVSVFVALERLLFSLDITQPNYSRTGWDCSPGWSRDRRHTDVMESKLE